MVQRMNVSLMISRRLRIAGSGRGPSRSGFVVAVAGVALALAVMMLSVAVVVGFKDAIRTKVAGYEAPLTLVPVEAQYDDGSPVALDFGHDSVAVDAAVRSICPAEARPLVSAVFDRPAVLKTDSDFLGVVLRAYGQEHPAGFEQGNVTEGALPADAGELALSHIQASALGLGVGDRVFCHFISASGVKTRRYTVSGIYAGNFGEYDRNLAYASALSLGHIGGVGTDCIEVRGISADDADAMLPVLQDNLDVLFRSGATQRPWVAQTMRQRGAMYYNWLELLDTNVVVILALMGCVCGFTLISSLIILILERVRMIGVLKSLGATDRQVMGVFMWLGARIVGIGLLAGNAVALALIWAQACCHFIPLDASSYYLDSVPVAISGLQIAALNAGMFLLALLLMLVPGVIVRRISPAAVMRYE